MNGKFAKLKEFWLAEEAATFSGWDFSRLDGRWQDEPLPWDYRAEVLRLLRAEYEILDMGTGGGEFLETLGHPYERTTVTEGYEPNYRLCLERLAPKGVRVVRWADPPEPLPFESESFDVVLDRHESYDFAEVFRVLRPGGVFITQQVGGENSATLSAILTPWRKPDGTFCLANERASAERAGFLTEACGETFTKLRFFDIGAVAYYARIIEWEFPDFSVEKCFDALCSLQEKLERGEPVENLEHRFFLKLRKPER